MTRIGNALLKEAPPRNLKIIEGIDPSEFASVDTREKTEKKHALVFVLLAIVLASAIAFGLRTYSVSRSKKVATEDGKKNTEYLEKVEMGVQRFKNHDTEGAIVLFQKAYDLRKNDPRLLVDLGMSYKAKKDLKTAEKFYQDAIKADPSYAVAYNNLAMLDAEEKIWPIATILLDKATELDPNQPAPLLNLAKIYEQTGDWTMAGVTYMKYMAHAKADPVIKGLIQKRMKGVHALSALENTQKEKQ